MSLPVKRKAAAEAGPTERMEIMPLGSGQEVGRSAVLCTFRGRTVSRDPPAP